MSVKLCASTCGTLTGEFAHLMEGGERDINGAVRTLRSSPREMPAHPPSGDLVSARHREETA